MQKTTQRKYLDLTHSLSSTIPVYPGAAQPQIQVLATIQATGFRQLSLHLNTHQGTHVDAPAHIIPNGQFLDQFPPEKFIGKGKVINLLQSEQQILKQLNQLTDIQYLLFWTGWDQHWNTNQYATKFPVVTQQMAKAIIQIKTIKGVGVDTLSLDCITSTQFPVHKILLGQNLILIQNLTNFKHLQKFEFEIMCFPMKILNSDGAPTRVIASYEQ